jgi:hypothetical protein
MGASRRSVDPSDQAHLRRFQGAWFTVTDDLPQFAEHVVTMPSVAGSAGMQRICMVSRAFDRLA